MEDEDYNSFYKAFSKDYQDPLSRTHFTAEGEVTFKAILFVPKVSLMMACRLYEQYSIEIAVGIIFIWERVITSSFVCLHFQSAPPNMFNDYAKPSDRIKLYVRRVFITDNLEDMMPKYLTFIRGVVSHLCVHHVTNCLQIIKSRKSLLQIREVYTGFSTPPSQVDSDDLPLNVSREMLQQHKLLKVIKKKLVRKALDMFKKMSKEDYEKFWEEYSTNIKLGVIEDPGNKTRLAKLLR